MALTKPMQQVRTLTANNPPANGLLLEGQLSVEYNPPRLWVGGPGGTTNVQLGAFAGMEGAPFLPIKGGTLDTITDATDGTSGLGLTVTNTRTNGAPAIAINNSGAGWSTAVALTNSGYLGMGITNSGNFGISISSTAGAGIQIDTTAGIGLNVRAYTAGQGIFVDNNTARDGVTIANRNVSTGHGVFCEGYGSGAGFATTQRAAGGGLFVDVSSTTGVIEPGSPGLYITNSTTLPAYAVHHGLEYNRDGDLFVWRGSVSVGHDGSGDQLRLPIMGVGTVNVSSGYYVNGGPIPVSSGGTGEASFAPEPTLGMGGILAGRGTTVFSSAVWGLWSKDIGQFFGANYGTALEDEPKVSFQRMRGTRASPTPAQTGDRLGTVTFDGINWAVGQGDASAQIRAYAEQNFTIAARGAGIEILTTPLNSSLAAPSLYIDSQGYLYTGGATARPGLDPTSRIRMGPASFDVFTNGWINLGQFASGGTGFWLSPDGNMSLDGTITATNFPSDMRLKENVADYSRGLAAVLVMRPISWQWNGKGGTKRDGKTYMGLLADDLEKIMPEAVDERETPPRPGRDLTTIKVVEDKPVICALINSVKELTRRLERLEAPRGGRK